MVVLKLKKINLMLLFPEQLTMKDKKGRRYNNLIEMIRFQWFYHILDRYYRISFDSNINGERIVREVSLPIGFW